MDVLVSLTVIVVLMAILLPSLNAVKETSRRLICRSNVRQVGFGIEMFADDRNDRIPMRLKSADGLTGVEFGEEENVLRYTTNAASRSSTPPADKSVWVGLGELYVHQYLPVAEIFYCPSQRGEKRFSAYADDWKKPDGLLIANYSYRGEGPYGIARLSQIQPRRAALVADGVWADGDTNHHDEGLNLLRADLSVSWFTGIPAAVSALQGGGSKDTTPEDQIRDIWDELDRGSRARSGNGPR